MKMPKYVLVVDDEAIIKNILKTFFESKGLTVITASSGGEGMRLLEKHPEIEIIITDVNCSDGDDMDGIWLAREIRKIDQKRECVTPIIFMSGGIAPYSPSHLVELTPFMLSKPFPPYEVIMDMLAAAYDSAHAVANP